MKTLRNNRRKCCPLLSSLLRSTVAVENRQIAFRRMKKCFVCLRTLPIQTSPLKIGNPSCCWFIFSASCYFTFCVCEDDQSRVDRRSVWKRSKRYPAHDIQKRAQKNFEKIYGEKKTFQGHTLKSPSVARFIVVVWWRAFILKRAKEDEMRGTKSTQLRFRRRQQHLLVQCWRVYDASLNEDDIRKWIS